MHHTLGIYEIFFIFLITLGPVKIFLPFYQVTEHLSIKDKFKVAIRAEVISAIIIILLVIFGIKIVDKWDLSRRAISLTGAIIMFLQGLVLVQANPAKINFARMLNITDTSKLTLPQITNFLIAPVIITPAGVTVILAVRSIHLSDLNSTIILSLTIAIIVLFFNFIAMILASVLGRFIKQFYLQIIGWIFSICLMILAVQIIINEFSRH
jgi:multiple antibiotic resistance protein